MDPSALVAALGATLPLLLLAALVSIVAAVVAGLALLRGHPHPFLVVLPVAVPLLVASMAGSVALWGLEADPSRAVAVAIGLRLVALFFALPAAAIVAVFGAVVGGRGTVRGWRRAAPVLALAWITAAITVAGGISQDDWLFPGLRAALYVVLGALLAVAHLGSDPEDRRAPGRPEAAAALGGLFTLIVAAAEVSARALETVFLLAVLPTVIPEGRAAYVEQALTGVILPSAPWHDLTMAWGAATGLVAIALALRSQRPGPASGALAWIAVALALGRMGAVDTDALYAVAANVPAVEPPAPVIEPPPAPVIEPPPAPVIEPPPVP